jgi:hypothetical protein
MNLVADIDVDTDTVHMAAVMMRRRLDFWKNPSRSP